MVLLLFIQAKHNSVHFCIASNIFWIAINRGKPL